MQCRTQCHTAETDHGAFETRQRATLPGDTMEPMGPARRFGQMPQGHPPGDLRNLRRNPERVVLAVVGALAVSAIVGWLAVLATSSPTAAVLSAVVTAWLFFILGVRYSSLDRWLRGYQLTPETPYGYKVR